MPDSLSTVVCSSITPHSSGTEAELPEIHEFWHTNDYSLVAPRTYRLDNLDNLLLDRDADDTCLSPRMRKCPWIHFACCMLAL